MFGFDLLSALLKVASFPLVAFFAIGCTSVILRSSSAEIQANVIPISASVSEKHRHISSDFMCFNVNSVRVKSWHNLDFIGAVRQLSPGVLRIPGGEVANYWDWQRGGLIVDPDGLPDGFPFFLKNKERRYTSSQLEDFRLGLYQTNTKPLFVLNMLSSNLDSQLEKLRQAERLGMPIEEVELGNEFYFGKKNNKAVFPTPSSYAEAASMWAQEIKDEFPNAKVSVVGVENYGLDPLKRQRPRRRDWNQDVLPQTLRSADAVTFHLYPGTGLESEWENSRNYPYFDTQDVPLILGEVFRYWHGLQRSGEFQFVPENKEIWITEYNLFEKQSGETPPRVLGTWTHGLYTLAMSLLFLEDPRVSKICNHVLVGSSQFAAIYSDTDSFVNPANPSVKSKPNGLSATGHALQFLGKALKDSSGASPLDFSGLPYQKGKQGFEYPALYGWSFDQISSQKRVIIMNMSQSVETIDITKLFEGHVKLEQISGSPRTLLDSEGQLIQDSAFVTDALTLPPYSVSLLSGR